MKILCMMWPTCRNEPRGLDRPRRRGRTSPGPSSALLPWGRLVHSHWSRTADAVLWLVEIMIKQLSYAIKSKDTEKGPLGLREHQQQATTRSNQSEQGFDNPRPMREDQPACLDGLSEAPGQEWLGTGGRVYAGRPGHRVGLVPVSEHHGGLHDACRGLPAVKIF